MKSLVNYINESLYVNEGKTFDKIKNFFGKLFNSRKSTVESLMKLNINHWKNDIISKPKGFDYNDQEETGYTLYEAGLIVDIYMYNYDDNKIDELEVQKYFDEHNDIFEPLTNSGETNRILYFFIPGLKMFNINKEKLNEEEIRESIEDVYKIPNIGE